MKPPNLSSSLYHTVQRAPLHSRVVWKPLHCLPPNTHTATEGDFICPVTLSSQHTLFSILHPSFISVQNEIAWGFREPKRVFPAPTHGGMHPPWANPSFIDSTGGRLTVTIQSNRALHRDSPFSSQPEDDGWGHRIHSPCESLTEVVMRPWIMVLITRSWSVIIKSELIGLKKSRTSRLQKCNVSC